MIMLVIIQALIRGAYKVSIMCWWDFGENWRMDRNWQNKAGSAKCLKIISHLVIEIHKGKNDMKFLRAMKTVKKK